MELVDSHCHLDDGQFAGDREAVIERAQASGIKWLLSIGTGDGPPELDCAIQLAERFPFILATVGVHPNDAEKIQSNTFEDLKRLLAHPKVRAIGEIGLDYHWGVPKEAQMDSFVRQLEIAADAKKPIVIHTREAWADTMTVLRTHWAPTGLPCVLHCFTGDEAQAREALELGFTLAFGGVTTFPKSIAIREALRIVPDDKLLLETDCPYLAPAPHRGKRNEPAYVAHTAATVARERNTDVATLGHITTANFERIFCPLLAS